MALFRIVGMDGTDRGRPGFSEKILGLRLALCPLSFLGRLKPFFSFWQRKKRMGSKKRFFGCRGNRKKRADRVVRPYKVQRRTQGCTVSVGCCLTAIIKIACGAGRTAKNQSATQRSGCGLERKKEGANMQFSALAGNGMQRVSSDAVRPYGCGGKS